MTDLTKIVAGAIAYVQDGSGFCSDEYTDEAQATLQAIEDAGLVIVPAEPTEAMLDAAWHQTGESNDMRGRVHTRYSRYYKAMTGAAK